MLINLMNRVNLSSGFPKIGRCNLSAELCGEARVNLPLELSLPADPFKWTKRQAQNWLCWLREVNDLDEIDITHFNFDGVGLCGLSQDSIEGTIGIRAGNIFRCTLDMLQSTAALVRQSPPASDHYSSQEDSSPKQDTFTHDIVKQDTFPFDTMKGNISTMLSPAVSQCETLSMSQQERMLYDRSQERRDSSEEVDSEGGMISEIKTPSDSLSPSDALSPGDALSPSDSLSPSESLSPSDSLSPRRRSVPSSPESSLETTADPFRIHPHYQTPGEEAGYNRSSVSDEDMGRLHPVAGREEEMLAAAHTLIKLERRRSSEGSVEVEEDKMNRSFFPNPGKLDRRPSHTGGRQGITLWQFILELLGDETCRDIVTWTERPLEFKVMNSKEIAERWGIRKNRPKMNYDKLSRALRYYYRKNLIQHVPGKRQVYFFVEHPESLDFTQLLNKALSTHPLRATRKQSAFTSVQSSNPAKRRASAPDILVATKRVRDSEPLSMLGYPGNMVSPQQLLTLQSPFTQQIPQFINSGTSHQDIRQPLSNHSMASLEALLSSAASNPALLSSSLMMTSPPPSALTHSLIPPSLTRPATFQTVLDSGLVKGVF